MKLTPSEQSLERYLSWKQLHPVYVNVSRSTAWRGIRDGEFPAPVRISRGRVAWRERDILAWQAARAPNPGVAA